MPDFFAERMEEDAVPLSREDSHHALRVLRLRPGDTVRVSVAGQHFAGMLEVLGEQAIIRVTKPLPSTEPETVLTLYQGWPKGDKFDLIVRQATEMGAARIVPVLFERSVARPEQAGRKVERLNRIAREAAMQSGRTCVPAVDEMISSADLPARLARHALALVLYENEHHQSLSEVLNGERDIALVIGPEGGLTQNEVASLSARAVTLGPRILRTETAGIAALAMVLALNRDFGTKEGTP